MAWNSPPFWWKDSAFEMTYIVSGGVLNSTHSLWWKAEASSRHHLHFLCITMAKPSHFRPWLQLWPIPINYDPEYIGHSHQLLLYSNIFQFLLCFMLFLCPYCNRRFTNFSWWLCRWWW